MTEQERQEKNAAEVERIMREFKAMGAAYFRSSAALQSWAHENPRNPIPDCYKAD